MRIIKSELLKNEVKRLCMEANYVLGKDIVESYKTLSEVEKSDTGKKVLDELYENANIASQERRPICQDTGMAIVFVEIGDQVFIEGNLNDAVNEGVKEGYTEGFLRKSIVRDPLFRENTGDNTPAIIHTKFVSGDKIKIIVAPKGFGSENMSKVKMLAPAEGLEGIKKFVLETVENAGPNPCPPIIVGIGIGGNFEYSTFLAKKALLRNIGDRNENKFYSELEEELLISINKLGIGPQGYGGKITALETFIEVHPTHIAGLPVAVNIGCHVNRHKEVII